MSDAILRTLFRLYVPSRATAGMDDRCTGRIPVAQRRPRILRQLAASLSFAVAVWLLLALAHSEVKPLASSFLLLWALSPLIAQWISVSPRTAVHLPISDATSRELRLVARRDWRFFETFITAADRMLPPDNFQEEPRPVVAHRTSPTNIGLYLLSIVAAHDFGWLGTVEVNVSKRRSRP
jgi:cyclic beta-1,2-glucan synthetase